MGTWAFIVSSKQTAVFHNMMLKKPQIRLFLAPFNLLLYTKLPRYANITTFGLPYTTCIQEGSSTSNICWSHLSFPLRIRSSLLSIYSQETNNGSHYPHPISQFGSNSKTSATTQHSLCSTRRTTFGK